MQRNALGSGRSYRTFQSLHRIVIVYLCGATLASGCRFPQTQSPIVHKDSYQNRADQAIEECVRQAEFPDTSSPGPDPAADTPEPRTLATELPGDDDSQYWNLSLQEVIHYGLMNSKVLNDLGGTILRNPDAVASNMMTGLAQNDPRFGIEGALSAYDARLNVSNKFANTNTAYNNLFLSGGNNGRTFTQELDTQTTELMKNTAAGGTLAVRNVTVYDKNSMPSNLFPSSFTTYYEAEARQSLLQGGGIEFNRIAGALGQPGYYNGVKIARIRADISQAEFEISLRDYLSNLENAYWDLHFSYRDLSSKVELRDLALEVYSLYKSRVENQQNEEGFRLAQVREQYYRFQEDVQNALTGRRVDSTRTNNGSIPGTFRGSPGVYMAERRLRLLMGVTSTDSRLIRPTDEASSVEVIFGWGRVKAEALERRPELARQRFQIKKAEMELVASRNYLRPRLDLVGSYRLTGFGQDLFGTGTNASATDPSQRFQNAYGNLATGQFQSGQVGVEFSMPLGYRQGHAAVTQAEFRVARERAILHEQERQIVHDVGNSVAEVVRSHAYVVSASQRRQAAAEYLEGMTNKIRSQRDFGTNHLEQWLEAQRRFAEADTQYHQALCENQIAIKNVNFEKGSLLDYCNIAPLDALPPTKEPQNATESELFPESTAIGFAPPGTTAAEPSPLGTNSSEEETAEETATENSATEPASEEPPMEPNSQ